MKYFIDVQYHSYEKKTGTIFNRRSVTVTDVISIGIVTEKGDSLYLINKDFDLELAWGNEKVREEILKPMYRNVSPIYGDDISKNSIAMVKGEHGDYLQTVVYKLRSFIGRYTDKHVMYVNDRNVVALLLGPLGCEGTFDEYRIIDNEIKKFAGDTAYSHLLELLEDKAAGLKSMSKYDAIVNSPRFPKRFYDKQKTALTEAILCKHKFEFIEKLKRDVGEDKKKAAERIQKELDQITGRVNRKSQANKVSDINVDDILNPADNTKLLRIEKGIKDILEFHLKGYFKKNDRVVLGLLSCSYGIKWDEKLVATFENFKNNISKDDNHIDYYARVLMQLTEEFLKMKDEEQARLDFISKCKIGWGCFVGGTDPYKKDSKVTIAEQRLGKDAYDFFMSRMYESVTPPPMKHKFMIVNMNYEAPKPAAREECDAPSRPKMELDFKIPRKEMDLSEEIMKKNDGKYYIDRKLYRDDSAEIRVYNRDTGAILLQVCGKKIEAMQNVLDFLNGKCCGLFCYQFEAVPNVNFRKRCVECGMEYDIKIKE